MTNFGSIQFVGSTISNMAAVGTLEDEALKRKERLRNLANKQHKTDVISSENEKVNEAKLKLPR